MYLSSDLVLNIGFDLFQILSVFFKQDAMLFFHVVDGIRINLLKLTKNCGCFGSAIRGLNRSPIGKASPSPVIPISLPFY
jgi:hypothetical protein